MLCPTIGRQQGGLRLAWRTVTGFLCFGILLHLFPIYFMMITSFKSSQEVLHYPPTWFPTSITIQAWKLVFKLTKGDQTIKSILPGGALYVYFVNSAIISAFTLILGIP